MKIFRQLKRNFEFLIFSNLDKLGWWWGWDDWKNQETKESLKNIEVSLDEKKKEILKFVNSDKLVSLDDNSLMKQDIKSKLDAWLLDNKQVNLIYSELIAINQIEDTKLTPDVLEKIDSDTKKEKVGEQFKKSREMMKEHLEEHKVEIEEAEERINKLLGL